MHVYGPSAARLETYLNRVIEALGYNGVFRSSPSEITFAFSKGGQWWQRTHIAPVPVGGYNMAKLAHVGELVEKLVCGDLTITEASKRLDEIDAMPSPWGGQGAQARASRPAPLSVRSSTANEDDFFMSALKKSSPVLKLKVLEHKQR